MTRPVDVDLTAEHERWRDIPMPGANLPLTMVRLDVRRRRADASTPGSPLVSSDPWPADTSSARSSWSWTAPWSSTVSRTSAATWSSCRPTSCARACTRRRRAPCWRGSAGMADFVEAAELSNSTAGGTRTVSVLDVEPGARPGDRRLTLGGRTGERVPIPARTTSSTSTSAGGAAEERPSIRADAPLLVRTRG